MTGKSWYDSGFSGMAAEQARSDSQYGPNRFWLKAGSQSDMVFVDDEPVCIYEHNPKINGSFKNWITCLNGVTEDVVCCQKLGLNSRYYCGYLTVVDCSEWVDQKGNKHQYELKLVQAKMKTLKKFRRKKEDKTSLVGRMYKASREDDKSPSCGDEFEFTRDVDMDKLFAFVNYRGKKLEEMWQEAERDPERMASLLRTFQIKPDGDGKLPRIIPAFNYYELLKPKQPKDLRIVLGAVEKDDDEPRRGGGGAKSSGATSDDVPF